MLPEVTTPNQVIAVGIIVFAIVFVIMSVVLVWAVKYVIGRSANAVQKEDFLAAIKSIRDDFTAELLKSISSDKLKIEMLEHSGQPVTLFEWAAENGMDGMELLRLAEALEKSIASGSAKVEMTRDDADSEVM